MDDDAIRVLVKRLARSHPSGGTVVERAAIVAEGTGSDDVMTWLLAHGAQPEATVVARASHGLHGLDRRSTSASTQPPPSRYILPPGALDG